MEAEIPTCWIPRDSDRIWRGSYKGKVRTEGAGSSRSGLRVGPAAAVQLPPAPSAAACPHSVMHRLPLLPPTPCLLMPCLPCPALPCHLQDWKYLGEGAWAPKGKAAAGGSGKKGGKKGGPGSKSRSSSASPSGSQPADSSVADSDEEEGSGDEEGEDEEMEGEESAQSAEPAAAAVEQQDAAPTAAPAAGRKRSAAAMAAGSGSPAAAGQTSAEPAADAAAGAAAEAEAPPPQKKARARTGRKRLDPIVRDALRAAEEKPGGMLWAAALHWGVAAGWVECWLGWALVPRLAVGSLLVPWLAVGSLVARCCCHRLFLLYVYARAACRGG